MELAVVAVPSAVVATAERVADVAAVVRSKVYIVAVIVAFVTDAAEAEETIMDVVVLETVKVVITVVEAVV